MSRASLFTQQVSSYLQSITQRQPLQETAFDVVVPLNRHLPQPAVIVDTVSQLLQRAEEYEVVSSAVIVNAVLYVHRFLRMTQTQLTSENVVPIATTAMCIANKFTEDIPYDNRTFWQLSGIPVEILAKLELHFLAALRFRLTVDPDNFRMLMDAFMSTTDRPLSCVTTPSKQLTFSLCWMSRSDEGHKKETRSNSSGYSHNSTRGRCSK